MQFPKQCHLSKQLLRKKTLAIILTAAMILSLLPLAMFGAAAATSGTCGDNLTWILQDGTLTISGTGNMYNFYDDYLIKGEKYKEKIRKI